MNFDAMAIWVVQEHLIPAGDRPAPIVSVFDSEFITAAHKALDVIGSEAEVAVTHGIHVLFHLEACFKVALRPVELNVAISQEIHLSCVSTIFSDATHHGVLRHYAAEYHAATL